MPVFPVKRISLKLLIIFEKFSNFIFTFFCLLAPSLLIKTDAIFADIIPNENNPIKIKNVLTCLKI